MRQMGWGEGWGKRGGNDKAGCVGWGLTIGSDRKHQVCPLKLTDTSNGRYNLLVCVSGYVLAVEQQELVSFVQSRNTEIGLHRGRKQIVNSGMDILGDKFTVMHVS